MFGQAVELSERAPPPAWQGEVEPLWLSYEANPFTGKPFFNEVSCPCKWQCWADFWQCYMKTLTVKGTRDVQTHPAKKCTQ